MNLSTHPRAAKEKARPGQFNYIIFKRSVDVVISLLVLVLIFPWLFPIIILLISLNSKGAAFFRQERVGFLGKKFKCYKFRTMYVNDSVNSKRECQPAVGCQDYAENRRPDGTIDPSPR
jgi:lipopolysaccharide/colanic/teichoic acid biosynthesis glycosyltransferase